MSYRDDPAYRAAERAFNVDRYLRDRGITVAEGGGPEAVCDCPRCGGKHKLYVNRVTKRFICFKCGNWQGGLPGLVMGIDKTSFGSALRYIVERAPTNPIDAAYAPAPFQRIRLPTADLPEHFRELRDPNNPHEQPYWTYVQTRGYDAAQVIPQYRMGYCLLGTCAGRLVIPIINRGKLVSWVARAVIAPEKPKVLTPKDNQQAATLFNLDLVYGHREVAVVEGIFDCLRAPERCVASHGKKLSVAQVKLLRQADVKELIIAWDADAYAEATAMAWRLTPFFEQVRIAILPEGHDPGSLPAEKFRDCLDAALPIEDWMTLEGAVARANDTGPLLRRV